MNSQHKDPGLSVRLPAEVKASSKAVLVPRGWDMTTFIGAALRFVAAEPDRLLSMLAPFKEEKPRGRPPQSEDL